MQQIFNGLQITAYRRGGIIMMEHINQFILENLHEIQGKHIILIDDVYTTGATLTECAKVLKKAGAKFVSALTVAKVID